MQFRPLPIDIFSINQNTLPYKLIENLNKPPLKSKHQKKSLQQQFKFYDAKFTQQWALAFYEFKKNLTWDKGMQNNRVMTNFMKRKFIKVMGNCGKLEKWTKGFQFHFSNLCTVGKAAVPKSDLNSLTRCRLITLDNATND